MDVLGLGVENLGDAEVEQLRVTLGRDHHVGRLDVAMDDVPIVRVLDRVENGKAQSNAIDRGEPMLVGIPIDARA